MVTKVRPSDVWRVSTRASLSARGSSRIAFVEDENTTWIHEPGSELDPSDSVITTPTGQWHIIAGGGAGEGSASYVATDEYRRMIVTSTPDDGETAIDFGITIPEDSQDAVGVYRNGLRLTQEADPLSSIGFKVNGDRQGITIGQAADGDDVFVLLAPVDLAENFSIYNNPLVEGGDTIEIADAVEIVTVYLNGVRINEGDEALEWQFSDDVLTVTGGWDDDHIVVEYSTVAAPGSDASDVSYTPTTDEDWPEGVPDNVQAALDTLAARESGGGGGGGGGGGDALVFDPAPDALFDPELNFFDVGLDEPAYVYGDIDPLRFNGRTVADFQGNANDRIDLREQLGVPANYTIIAAICPDSTGSVTRALGSIASNGASTNSWGTLQLNSPDDGQIRTIYGNGAGGWSSTDTDEQVIEARVWQIVAIRHVDGEVGSSIFVDGVEVAVTHGGTGATDTGGAAEPFAIGRQGAFTGNPMNGAIGVVAIWQSALTDQEVVDNMEIIATAYGL